MSRDIAQACSDLEQNGYCRIASVFTPAVVAEALARVRALAADHAAVEPRDIPRLDQGQQTVYNLQNKDVALLKLLLDCDVVRAVLVRFLNDEWHRAIPLDQPNYILRSFSARNNRVAAPLHIDSFIPYQGHYPLSMQVAVILEPQAPESGCTVVVPGSHQSGEYVTQDQRANAVPIESGPGDVVIWDSRVWHGTLANTTSASRWSLIATFVRWWVKQGYDITGSLPRDIYRQLSDRDRAVLGYCARPLRDEQAGIDFKKGYEWLKQEFDND